MSAIPERLRGVVTTRCYTNPRLPYLTLPYLGLIKSENPDLENSALLHSLTAIPQI